MKQFPSRAKYRRMPATTAGRQDGIALIEALVSILIFSFGLLGLIGLEARAINFSADAEDRNRASLFANEVASAMWTGNSVTLTPAAILTLKAAVADNTKTGLPSGQLNVTVLTANTANIVITWKAPSRLATDPVSNFTTQVILP
jgi:type IV pilus assembly protein PilV